MHKSKNVTVRETKSKTKIKIMENGDWKMKMKIEALKFVLSSKLTFFRHFSTTFINEGIATNSAK